MIRDTQPLSTTDPTTELRQLARQVRDYQTERGWSDAQLAREVSQIGSTKTYKRILDDDDALDEGLSIANQLTNFQNALAFIAMQRAKDKVPEPEYDDFTNVLNSLCAVARAMTEDSAARFVAIQGETGTGKDAVRNALVKRWGNVTLAVEATTFWMHSAATPINTILAEYANVRKVKDLKPKNYPAMTFELLCASIGDQRLILLINEAHHIGPRGLDMIKSLINACPKLVIVAEFIPALLRRLQTQAYEEAAQLFGNRLCERVTLPTPPAEEVVLFLERRGVKFGDAKVQNQAARELSDESRNFGNWRFITAFSREARKHVNGHGLTLENFAKARDEAKRKRVANQGRAS